MTKVQRVSRMQRGEGGGRGQLTIYLASIEQDSIFGAISQARRCSRHVEVKTIACRPSTSATRTTTTTAAARGTRAGARAGVTSSRAVDDQTIGTLGLTLQLMLREGVLIGMN